MGLFDDFVDAVGDVGGAVVDAAESAVDTVTTVVEDTLDTATGGLSGIVTDAVGGVVDDATDYVEDAVGGAVGSAVDWFGNATEDLGEWALDTADDYLFDNVDYLTGGILDVDYDNGNFSANVDLGVANAGVSYGEDGFSANATADIGIVSADVSYADGDFSASGSAGVDWGPLPYVEGHVVIDDEGTIDIGGRAQGTIPTPYGIVSGSAEGGYHQLPDGSWGAYGGAEGSIITPAGVTVSAGGNISYEVEADGDEVFNAGGHVGVGYVGGPSVEAGGEYHYIEDDGTLTEGGSGYVEGEGYGVNVRADGSYDQVTDADGNVTETYEGGIEGSGYGMGASAGGQYVEQSNADGTSSTSSDAWADVDGLDTDDLMAAAGSYLGEAASDYTGDLPGAGDIADTVSNLAGSGDLSDVVGGMADSAGSNVLDVAGDLADSGNFDDFSSDVISSEVVEAVADETWDDLIE